ncbi:hypothetical protein SMACR_09594 [Sordaria macrospora]|uniref:Reverse transcriptase domain-containing protein n=1 Tax=Sordaria macrospora TaxID=5147 RepID=A0A8S8ZRV9_SORMA|nr:hypothetical protein SMACR_09594 [Sordaria macrospora]WPJ63909.1 hypothetical protein SMAC4_09594 [Sordaria macrospora]
MNFYAKRGETIEETSLCEINGIIEAMQTGADLLPEDEEGHRQLVMEKLPKKQWDRINVFSKKDSDTLPELKEKINHKIELEEGKSPQDLGYNSLYKMTLEELEECRQYITENLQKGFIKASSAPWVAPILFVPKGNGGLRFCVDYHKLNALSKKDRYPLPLIDETLACISQAKVFTKVDIRQAFHRIRMHPDHEDLTTFRTRYGAYKYKVLPFGLTGGPSSFQRFINEVLMGYLDNFCSAYIDDILIYSNDQEDHDKHVDMVLRRLEEAGLQADIKKCAFSVTKTKFLGFIIGTDGISVDPEKVAAVKEWKVPNTVKSVQEFLGFCNFYRKFIKDFSRIAKPLTNLTKKDLAFKWNDHASGGLMSQLQEDGEWHPVAFYSETMNSAEFNYPVHDKELMAVMKGIEQWQPELKGTKPFTIFTDHQALEYFNTKRVLNGRQVRWSETLSEYQFRMTYRPGKDNVAADALSRKLEDLKTVKNKKEDQFTLRMLKPADDGFFTFAGDKPTEPEEREPPPNSEGGNEAVGIEIAELEVSHDLTEELIQANRSAESLSIYRFFFRCCCCCF